MLESKSLDLCENFIDDNKKEIFCFFKENSPFFPSCCVDIALMLKYFIKEYFNMEFEMITAQKTLYQNNRKFHIWLQKKDQIIDFSLFQFYIGKNRFKKLSAVEAYGYCIEEIQRDNVFFDVSYYNKLFKENVIADSKWYLSQYQESLWEFPVDKELPAIASMRNYFEKCKLVLF